MRPSLPYWVFGGETLGDRTRDLLLALYNAIPEDEIARLRSLSIGTAENGGLVRGSDSVEGVVASYNNTRRSEQDIIDWFERALVGVTISTV